MNNKKQKIMNAYVVPGITEEKQEERPEDKIFRETCEVYGFTPEEVLVMSKTRERPYVTIRQITMTLLKEKMIGWPWHMIGGYFGQNHATAMHAHRSIRNLWQTDKSFRELTESLFKDIKL